MSVIYIISLEKGVGKTAICAGLAINLLNAGKKVSYLKPQSAGDSDIAFMKKIPGLDVDKKGKGIVLTEEVMGKQTADAVKENKARVIAVEDYAGRIFKDAGVYKQFGKDFLGVIINKVPQKQTARIKKEAEEKYGAAGIKVLGVIPENRILLAITVGELAESIGGKILNHADKSNELVENYMLGAMVVDSGLDYFGRKQNKAAVIRQERLDMQLAALETSMRCLVLSGGGKAPSYGVRHKAESKGIPIITTDAAVDDIVKNIDNALAKTRLNQAGKLAKLADAVRHNLNLEAFG